MSKYTLSIQSFFEKPTFAGQKYYKRETVHIEKPYIVYITELVLSALYSASKNLKHAKITRRDHQVTYTNLILHCDYLYIYLFEE